MGLSVVYCRYEACRLVLGLLKERRTRKWFPKHPGTPLGDGFDASGDSLGDDPTFHHLSSGVCGGVPAGSAGHDDATNPTPTVTISSTGRANIAFSPSGDMWMVTGGGSDCYGTPVTTSWSSSPGASSPRRAPPPLPSRSAQPNLAPAGPGTAPTGSPSTQLSGDVWGSPTSTPPLQWSSAGTSFSSRGRPLLWRTIAGPNMGMNWPSLRRLSTISGAVLAVGVVAVSTDYPAAVLVAG